MKTRVSVFVSLMPSMKTDKHLGKSCKYCHIVMLNVQDCVQGAHCLWIGLWEVVSS